MIRARFAPQDAVHTMILHELGIGVRPVFTRTRSGFYWAKLNLPAGRFTCDWVCCPGETREAAVAAAIRQAKRYERMVA